MTQVAEGFYKPRLKKVGMKWMCAMVIRDILTGERMAAAQSATNVHTAYLKLDSMLRDKLNRYYTDPRLIAFRCNAQKLRDNGIQYEGN